MKEETKSIIHQDYATYYFKTELDNKKMKFNDLNIQWSQKGRHLYLTSFYGTYYFKMPKDWRLDEVSDSLLRLAESLIFLPFITESGDELFKAINWIERKPIEDGKVGLAFSGGVDSAAAAILMQKDDVVLCYLKRDGFKTKLKHGNQLRCLEWFKERGYKGFSIETNIELLRSKLKKDGKPLMSGFLTDYVVCLPAILLADHLGLSHVTTGQILDSTYLWKGHKYRDFANSWYYNYHKRLFKAAGLPMFWAVGACSEVVTTIICKNNSIPAESCLRREKGSCGMCYKCFRKNAYHGGRITVSPIVKKIINKKPLKMGASMVAIAQKRKISTVTNMYPNVDVSFEYGYYSQAYEEEMNLPKRFKNKILENIEKNVSPMSVSEVEMLKNFDLI